VKELAVAGVTPSFVLAEAASYMATPPLSSLPLALPLLLLVLLVLSPLWAAPARSLAFRGL